MRRRQTTSPGLELVPVVECVAEKALARLIINKLGINRRPKHPGGHGKAISEARKLAKRKEAHLVLLVIDYERGKDAERYTREICKEKLVRTHQVGRGTKILMCIKRLGSVPILAVVWDPRSEEVIEAATGPLKEEELQRIKSDEEFVRERIESSRKLLSVVEEAAALVRSLTQKR